MRVIFPETVVHHHSVRHEVVIPFDANIVRAFAACGNEGTHAGERQACVTNHVQNAGDRRADSLQLAKDSPIADLTLVKRHRLEAGRVSNIGPRWVNDTVSHDILDDGGGPEADQSVIPMSIHSESPVLQRPQTRPRRSARLRKRVLPTWGTEELPQGGISSLPGFLLARRSLRGTR